MTSSFFQNIFNSAKNFICQYSCFQDQSHLNSKQPRSNVDSNQNSQFQSNYDQYQKSLKSKNYQSRQLIPQSTITASKYQQLQNQNNQLKKKNESLIRKNSAFQADHNELEQKRQETDKLKQEKIKLEQKDRNSVHYINTIQRELEMTKRQVENLQISVLIERQQKHKYAKQAVGMKQTQSLFTVKEDQRQENKKQVKEQNDTWKLKSCSKQLQQNKKLSAIQQNRSGQQVYSQISKNNSTFTNSLQVASNKQQLFQRPLSNSWSQRQQLPQIRQNNLITKKIQQTKYDFIFI